MSKKQFFTALSPLLLFILLIVPYSWINQAFLVDWLGCGCPQIDASGNIYEPAFNANDFTACFWFLVAGATGTIAFFLSRRIFPGNKLLGILYTVAMTIVSLLTAYLLWQRMLWK